MKLFAKDKKSFKPVKIILGRCVRCEAILIWENGYKYKKPETYYTTYEKGYYCQSCAEKDSEYITKEFDYTIGGEND